MPFKIAHRGNLNGRDANRENRYDYLLEAIAKGYDVETDLWMENGVLFLGHDKPSYRIDERALEDIKDRLWCHAKDVRALEFLLKSEFHCFFHNVDDATLTSKGFIWTFPGKELTQKSIAVLPQENLISSILETCAGVCSNYF